MPGLHLFTDGSVDNRSKIGYGAYLVVSELGAPLAECAAQVKVRRFEETSSSKLELQTLLWALAEIEAAGPALTVYVDSQNIISLPARRERLEQHGYRSRNRERLELADLYREFYCWSERFACTWVKVRGHRPSRNKDELERLFTLVDRASRQALRAELRKVSTTDPGSGRK